MVNNIPAHLQIPLYGLYNLSTVMPGGSRNHIHGFTDSADVEGIVKSFTETPKRGSGNCGFYVYKFTFIGKNERVIL